jgi:hypothetical protein
LQREGGDYEEGNVELDDSDLTDWRVIFEETTFTPDAVGTVTLPQGNIQAETTYYVRSNDQYTLTLEDSGGSLLTFDASDVLYEDTEALAPDDYWGCKIRLLPPEGIEKTGGDITIVDGKKWAYDQNEDNQKRPNQPETRILERDRTIISRTKFNVAASPADRTSGNDRFTIASGDVTELFDIGDTVTFEPDVNVFLGTALGDLEITGSVTVTLQGTASGISVRIRYWNITAQNNLRFTFDVSGGTTPYDVDLEFASKYDATYSTVESATYQNAGQQAIIENFVPDDGQYFYRLEVTDDTGSTVTSEKVSIDFSAPQPIEEGD